MEKMDIFISWSGPRSRAVAEALKEYLPMIVNAFNPWLSCADIDKGARWISELSAALATAKAGIICLTPNNLTAPYILFESGALSKTVEKTYVCTLLIEMEPSDVSGPLAQFQATKPTKVELLQLLKTLNRALGNSAVKEQQLDATFELCWPKLNEKFQNLPPDGPTGRPERPERELLEELIDLARTTSMDIAEVNHRVSEQFETSSSIMQGQIDHLTNVLMSASSLSPAMGALAALGGPAPKEPTDKDRAAKEAFWARTTGAKAQIAKVRRDRFIRTTPEDEPDKK
jgi:hypothetical protein